MIRSRENGTYYCDGRGCGYELSFTPADPEEFQCAALTCPDCWASIGVGPVTYDRKTGTFRGIQSRPQSPSDGGETTKTGNSGLTPYPLSGDQ